MSIADANSRRVAGTGGHHFTVVTSWPTTPEVPQWVVDRTVSLPERLLLLTYRVARRAGASRRRSSRLCRRVLKEYGAGNCRQPVVSSARQTGTCADRHLRADAIRTLRTRFRRSGPRLETAIEDAILLDELALLPPRQRFALWAAAVQHDSMADIGRRTGWTPAQVARLLRAALRTVTANTYEAPRFRN